MYVGNLALTYYNLLLPPSCKPAEKVRQFPGNMIPSKLKQLTFSWYWYSVHVDFVPKVSIRHWDYEKVSSSTYTFGTRQLTFSSPPTYVDIPEYYCSKSFLQLPLYCSYAASLILGICIGGWFWTDWVINLWAWCGAQHDPRRLVPTLGRYLLEVPLGR